MSFGKKVLFLFFFDLSLVVWQKCASKEENLEKNSALGFLVPLEAKFYVD